MANALPANGKHAIDGDVQTQRYFVASGQGGGWLVFREGSSRAVHKLPAKNMAIHTAKIMARCNCPSQVLVEQVNGSFALHYDFDHFTEQRGY